MESQKIRDNTVLCYANCRTTYLLLATIFVTVFFTRTVFADIDTPSPEAFPALVIAQLGYPTWATKRAAYVSRTDDSFPEIDVVDFKTGKKYGVAHQDRLHPTRFFLDLNQWVTLIDFSDVKRKGTYELVCGSPKMVSLPFRIDPDPYLRLASVAAKMLYFQRVGVDIDKKYAGPWAHKAWHTATQLSSLKEAAWPSGNWFNLSDTVIDPGPLSVSGGWYDGGDPDVYSKNEALTTDALILAYDWVGKRVKPSKLEKNDIPESGDGLPDLINEALVGANYLLSARDRNFAEYDRLLCGDPNKPVLKFAEPCSGATACAVGSLAMAAAVLDEHNWRPSEAKALLEGALESWLLLEARPGYWPLEDDVRTKQLGSFGWDYGDEAMWRALAASALYRATGDPTFGTVAKNWLDNCGAPRINTAETAIIVADNIEVRDGSNSPELQNFVQRMLPDADDIMGDVNKPVDQMAYGAGSRDGCFCGSTGTTAGDAWEMAWIEEHAGRSPANAAVSYLDYLTGLNPSRYCFCTNLAELGADNSIPTIFSFQAMQNVWPESNGIVQSPPGYLVGGPTDATETMPDVATAPRDSEHFEPSINYQQNFILLTTYCAYGIARQ